MERYFHSAKQRILQEVLLLRCKFERWVYLFELAKRSIKKQTSTSSTYICRLWHLQRARFTFAHWTVSPEDYRLLTVSSPRQITPELDFEWSKKLPLYVASYICSILTRNSIVRKTWLVLLCFLVSFSRLVSGYHKGKTCNC